MTSPYLNLGSGGGALPWGNGGAGALSGLGGSPQQALNSLGSDYANAYQSSLAMNQTNYNNILSGYSSLMSSQQAAEAPITAGYGQLENQVMGTIQGITASQQQAIKDVYAQQSGAASQQMINSGLGNSTVQQSVQRGLTLDEQKAQVALANQQAQLTAGYQSNLGLAGLNWQQQALGQNTGLGVQQLNWMNSVNATYPNAGMYAQLAQGYGAMQAAQQARGMLGGGSGLTGTYGATGFTPPTYPQSVQASGGGMTPGTGAAASSPYNPGGGVNYGDTLGAVGSGALMGGIGAAGEGNPYAPYANDYEAMQSATPGYGSVGVGALAGGYAAGSNYIDMGE